ncbi:MAG: hypothetical protein BHW64_03695 [Candidatus Melainabacteria bacterium LEY3_CP_29_8]|nr:MAG: hypothetical protein BHW64_03695 [Candidatus Melainabacteria bacterium LEY3_CP_29_8]
MINNPKISNTCLRVFEVIKLLIQKPYSIEELSNILSEKEDNRNVYTQETIIKYITTLRVMGLKVAKEKRKFVLKKFPLDLNLNEKELKTLEKIENYIINEKQQSCCTEFKKLISTLEKCFDNETIDRFNTNFSFLSVEKNVNNMNDIPLINKFEKICNDQQKLKIDYVDINTKNTDTYYLEPKCVKIIHRQGFLQAYDSDTNELKLFLLRNIRKVVQRPQRTRFMWYSNEVIYRLDSEFAKIYKLKTEEKLLSKESDGSIVIQNCEDDKESFLKRLLKYTTHCEIIRPEKYRKKMLSLIENTIDIYKEDVNEALKL